MGTSRCWQEDVVKGFVQKSGRGTVAGRKKNRRMEVRKIIKELKAAGKKVDLQAINHQVLGTFRRRKQTTKARHLVLTIK